jgi:ribosome biogenesis GTPase
MNYSEKNFLDAFGWNEHFEAMEIPASYFIGRVVNEERERYRIQVGMHEQLVGELAGRFYHQVVRRFDMPAVGDWVCFTPLVGSNAAIIHQMLPRQRCLYRKVAGDSAKEQILAANVDTAFIVSSLNLDLNVRRFERYLILCRESAVRPVIVLSKADLVEDVAARIAELQRQLPDVELLALSSLNGQGMDALHAMLAAGQSFVVLGSSGVGKSTLVNHLLGSEVLKTQDIRAGDDKGKHTTTSRSLFRLAGGALLIDTPGMRELQLFGHNEGLSNTFADIEALARSCRYQNCGHQGDEGCAIAQALHEGRLDEARLKSYKKVQRELAFQARKEDKSLARVEKDKWKKIHKEQKKRHKKQW